jgi:lipoprotein-anchoring transpeptidase ErfK/SrfK
MRRGRTRTRVASVAAAAAAVLVIAAIAIRASTPVPERAAAVGLPAPVKPAFVPGPPRPLAPDGGRSHWAPVLHATVARAAPDPAERAVTTLATRTPEGTRNIVAVVARAADAAGGRWVRVRLAVLPNGTTGWVPRAALGGYGTVTTRLDVDLGRLRATLYRDGHAIFSAPVAVGAPDRPTPRGEFYVRNRLTRYSSPAYGPVAFGTSARSPTATGWPAGGFVGIHGTDRPDLVPGRVSHGCIRMRNADIAALARRMPVGTPLIIR